MRDMVRETELTPRDLVYPMFVELGTDSRTPIEAMPGVDRLSISHAVEEAGEAHALGIPAVLLFGIPRAQGRGRLAAPTTTRASSSSPRARSRTRIPTCS